MFSEIASVPGADSWQGCERLTLGWSSDQKYIITDESGQKRLLRTAKADQFETKRAEFEFLQKIEQLGVNASRPIDFGRFEGGVYTLYTWIEGESMESALPALPAKEQYELGYEAGRILRCIHSLPAPDGIEPWHERMGRKMDRKIRMACECEIEIPGREQMIAYINSHRHLLNNRSQCMQHGDYHCGNLVLTPDHHVDVIDFNRFDVAEPWEEFNRIVWCAQASPLFASGRINGYFHEEGAVPSDFFPLVTMYILSNQLSSLPWAIPFGQKEIDVMLKQAKEVLSWYDGCTRDVPNWYLIDEQAQKL